MADNNYDTHQDGSSHSTDRYVEAERDKIDVEKDSESRIRPDDVQTGSVRSGLVGAFFGLGVCLSFVAATQFTQSTYSPSFNGPFFNMWFSTSWMMACYPLYVVITILVFPERRKRGIRNIYDEDQQVYGERGLTLVTAIKVTGPFLILWMLTNYVFVRALGITSATVVTTLFVTNTVVVYVLSWILLTEVVAQIPSKVLSVILSMTGTVLVSYSEGFEAGNQIVGAIILPLLAATGSAIYKVVFKRVIGDASLGQVSLFLSVLGFLDLVSLWPVLLALYFTGEESWDVIPWGFLCGSSALIVVFNFLVNFGIATTFPLLISLGHVLGIPANAVVDVTFRGTTFSTLKLIGGALIVVGFIFMVLPASYQEKMAFGCFRRKAEHQKLDSKEEREEGLEEREEELELKQSEIDGKADVSV